MPLPTLSPASAAAAARPRLVSPGAQKTNAPYLDALAELQGSAPWLINGHSNHAPMVVEALFNMGGRDRIAGWMARTAETRAPRDLGEVEPAEAPRLGEPAPFGAFRRQALAELERRPWRDVVRDWAARLAPGFAGAALHGVIRLGHAVRGLERLDHAQTRAELASGLAYWACVGAASNGPLPAPAGSLLSLSEAWPLLNPVPEEKRRNGGSIVAALEQVRHAEGREPLLARLAWPEDPVEATRAVADLFLDLYLGSARDYLTALVFTHALTGLAAAWTIGRATDPALHAVLVRESFKAGADLHLAYSPLDNSPGLDRPEALPSRESLIAGAFDTDDDHAIKLTDACLLLEEICEEPRFRAAAQLGQYLMA